MRDQIREAGVGKLAVALFALAALTVEAACYVPSPSPTRYHLTWEQAEVEITKCRERGGVPSYTQTYTDPQPRWNKYLVTCALPSPTPAVP